MLDKNADKLYRLRAVSYLDVADDENVKFYRSKKYWALHYVISGSGHFLIRNSEYKICKGMFFLTPPFEPINYYSDEPDLWKYYYISGFPDSVIDVAHPLGLSNGCFATAAKHPKEIERLFEGFFEKAAQHDDIYFDTLTLLNKILSLEYERPQKEVTAAERKADIVKQIDEIIGFNYKNFEFSISDISMILKIHPSRLSREYKEVKGETPISHLVNMRLEHAVNLLQRESVTVSELCRSCGFYDERYFMKRFKKKFGKTVGEYRKEILRK